MQTVDIIVMGKTGAGKSTLINAVFGEDIAPTGTGQAITKRNMVYSKDVSIPDSIKNGKGHYASIWYHLNMCDTVGLEIDSTITNATLRKIKKHINETKNKSSIENLNLVWFCISEINKRFETYEIELINKLSIDYEIPFVIVITQSISKKKGNLERQIEEVLPDVPLAKVLAKEYPIDDEVSIPPKGVDDLLCKSIKDYQGRKVKILETKLNLLNTSRKDRISKIESEGNKCIADYSSTAEKIGILPAGCIPFVHGICIKMMVELNDIAGIKGDKALVSDIFTDAVLGVIATPFMAVPLLSIPVAKAYVETVGEGYLKVLITVIDNSSDRDLKDNALMADRIKEELRKLKK